MPGSSQVSGPIAAYDRDDMKFVTDPTSTSFPCSRAPWYVTRDVIERSSPSRRDGIDSASENILRKSYCAFLRELGIQLKMPHVVIATATMFCHRFYLHQSHQKNDRFTIATACIFLAGKVEEARRPLEEVALISYSMQTKNNPMAAEEIKEKEVVERQKELILVAEQVVLVTLDFNLKVRHPYGFLITATSKYKSAPDALVRVACIIVNDVLYTSLCLQFKPQHIAAGALFLAAKLLRFKLPWKGWWKDFSVALRQLEEISNQVLELYEQERVPFCFVQSSSSSSSVDEKAKFSADAIAITSESVKCWNGTPELHHNDNGAVPSNGSHARSKRDDQTSAPIIVGHSSQPLPTESKSVLKEPPKPRNSESKAANSEVLAKRKRIEDSPFPGNGNLAHPGRPKPGVVFSKKVK